MQMSFSNLLSQMMISTNPGDLNGSLVSKYQQVQNRAWISRLLACLMGRSNHILSLDKALADHPVEKSHYAGIQSVSVDEIRGSENRSTDFDRSFNPLSGKTMSRWLSVARARMTGVALPPVDLIKVGDSYFVRDGHHRISVAHALGESFIEAEVTVWDIAR